MRPWDTPGPWNAEALVEVGIGRPPYQPRFGGGTSTRRSPCGRASSAGLGQPVRRSPGGVTPLPVPSIVHVCFTSSSAVGTWVVSATSSSKAFVALIEAGRRNNATDMTTEQNAHSSPCERAPDFVGVEMTNMRGRKYGVSLAPCNGYRSLTMPISSTGRDSSGRTRALPLGTPRCWPDRAWCRCRPCVPIRCSDRTGCCR